VAEDSLKPVERLANVKMSEPFGSFVKISLMALMICSEFYLIHNEKYLNCLKGNVLRSENTKQCDLI